MKNAYIWEFIVFFAFTGAGLWLAISDLWGFGFFWVVSMFVIGGVLARVIFKSLATPKQAKEDLEHRWLADDLHPNNNPKRK